MDKEIRQIIIDIKHTFSSETGKRVLEHLRRFCLAQNNQSAFDATSVAQTSYNLGAQSVYRYIAAYMELSLSETETAVACEAEPRQE